MAVNRYDTPAQADFINTYVPIPFEQLYTLGKAAGDRLDKTMRTYADARKLWKDFQSQSAIDMKRWDDLTMGRVRPLVDAAAANPDLMKDASWQMQLQSTIANTDTAALGALRQNADNFNNYLKSVQELAKTGKYNPNWHNKSFSNWDTLGNDGLFNETPLAYQSVPDLVNPYVDNLEDTDLGSKGGYLWYGVSKERARQQVDAHRSDILNTPQAQKHIQEYINSGLTKDRAVETFMNEAYLAAEERARINRKADPYGLLSARVSYANQAAQANNPDVYAQAYTTANEELNRNIMNNPDFVQSQVGIAESNRIYNEIASLTKDLQSGVITQRQYDSMLKDYEEELKGMSNALRNDARNIFTRTTSLLPNQKVSDDRLKDYTRGASALLNSFFSPSSGQIDDVFNTSRANNTIKFRSNDLETNGYVIPTTQGIMSAVEYANKLMGVGNNNTKFMVEDNTGLGTKRNIFEMIKDGSFRNVIKVARYQNTTTNLDGSNVLKQRVTLLIPKTAIEAAGLDVKDFDRQYEKYFGSSISGLAVKDQSDSNGAKERTLQDDYYEFDCVEEMPNSGTLRTILDQNANKVMGGSTMQNNEYGSNIDQSYQSLLQDVMSVMR